MEAVTRERQMEAVSRALERQPRAGATDVDGTRIAWLSWGDPGRVVVFVHGGAAHSWWWAFSAPLLADDSHVVAVDLSGHGESDRRPRYDFSLWAREVVTVATSFSAEPPIVVGHSMGGLVTSLVAGGPDAHRLAGVVIVDAPFCWPPGSDRIRWEESLGKVRTYPDRQSAIEGFRLRPRQPVQIKELHDYIAVRSVEPTADGSAWTWRYDPRIFQTAGDSRPTSITHLLEAAPCPVGVVLGGDSAVITEQDKAAVADLASRGRVRQRVIQGAGHHVMLDRPVELMTVIAELAREWVDPATAAGRE